MDGINNQLWVYGIPLKLQSNLSNLTLEHMRLWLELEFCKYRMSLIDKDAFWASILDEFSSKEQHFSLQNEMKIKLFVEFYFSCKSGKKEYHTQNSNFQRISKTVTEAKLQYVCCERCRLCEQTHWTRAARTFPKARRGTMRLILPLVAVGTNMCV